MSDTQHFKEQLIKILEASTAQISSIKPSDWAESNVMMGKPFPGRFKYDQTPYTREIIDCLAPDHPARRVAVMKGAQIGFSSGVIYPGVGWIIANNPGNTYVTVGQEGLIEKAMEKLDLMLDSSGLRLSHITSSSKRLKSQKSGDTNLKKEFIGGYVTVQVANNHKAWRQVDLQFGFVDDYESIRSASKESGSTLALIEQRFAAYAGIEKIFFISTPERDENSNIKEVYLLGDQRKYLCPCPHCHKHIEWKWSVVNGDITGGITWKENDLRHVIPNSVGYICPECGGFFTDKTKYQMLNDAFWKPTADMSRLGYYSYHISSLYAPVWMYSWEHYVNDWIKAHPKGQPRIERLYQTFVNVVLGEPYKGEANAPTAKNIQRNTRQYEVGIVPESISHKDGNGDIVMLTCAADLNGFVNDARLDYEIVGWSREGASYSIKHGSIGTFVRGEGKMAGKTDRKQWSYEYGKELNVWSEFDKILDTVYDVDTGRKMKVYVTGLDTGNFTVHAYEYMDRTNHYIMGLKGDVDSKYVRTHMDRSMFKVGKNRVDLYILEVNLIKDMLSEYMHLNWDRREDKQPIGFMNFPQPSNGLYGFENYFEHFESEHCVYKENAAGDTISKWEKKSSHVQNHMWDCRVYNIAVREIFIFQFGKEMGIKNPTWEDFCNAT